MENMRRIIVKPGDILVSQTRRVEGSGSETKTRYGKVERILQYRGRKPTVWVNYEWDGDDKATEFTVEQLVTRRDLSMEATIECRRLVIGQGMEEETVRRATHKEVKNLKERRTWWSYQGDVRDTKSRRVR